MTKEVEEACGVPFSKRQFAIMAMITQTALSDYDALDAYGLQLRVVAPSITNSELENLRDKVNDFLDI